MKYVLVWLVLAVALGAGVGSLNVPAYYRMMIHGKQVQGTVVQLTPDFHATVRYQYEVAGIIFQGQTQPGPPNPFLNQLHAGQSIMVYYDPNHPDVSALRDPGSLLKNELMSVGLVMIVFPTFVICFGWRKSKKSSKKNSFL